MFIRNVLSYSAVNAYAQLIRLLQDFVVRFILPPSIMGIWSLVLVLQGFATTFDIGVLTAATRELPLLYGAGRRECASFYKSTAFLLHFGAKVVTALLIISYTFIRYSGTFNEYTYAGLAAGALIILTSIGEAFIYFYQSEQRYVELSKQLMLYWTCYAITIFLGVYFAGLTGLIVANLIALIIQAILLKSAFVPFANSRRFAWNSAAAKSLLSFALPFRAIDYPMSIAENIDGLIIAKFFSLKILAIYMTAKLICNQTGQIPTWVGNVFIVRLTTMIGSGEHNKRELGTEALQNLYVQYLFILPIIMVLAYHTAQFGIDYFIPKYRESLAILPVLLLSLYFQPRVTVIRNFWIINKNFKQLGISNIFVILASTLGFTYLFLSHNLTLIHVAWIYVLAYCSYFIYVFLKLGAEIWENENRLQLAIILVCSTLFTYFSLHTYIANTATTLFEAILQYLENLFLSLMILVPVFLLGIYQLSLQKYLSQRMVSWKNM